MRTREYKVAVGGEVADRMLQAMPEVEWLNKHRVSKVVFVVTVEEPTDLRTEDGFRAYQDTPAYLLDVMVEDEGTFPDFQAVHVTGKPWSVFP